MTTYYVGKHGNNANAGTVKGSPKLTIAAGIGAASADDTVEILDEGSYNEGGISILVNGLTVTHTASSLGRPKMHGTGLAGNPGLRAFYLYGGFTTYIGLEISNYDNYALHKGDSDYYKFHISGCFIHDVPKFGHASITGDSTTKSTIKDSVLYFSNGDGVGLNISSNVTLNNCLITSSNHSADTFVGPGNATVTASFCTFIARGGLASAVDLIIQAGKVINCIVSGSGGGLSSDDHSYNLVLTSGPYFRNLADNADGSPGAGDISGSIPLFVGPTVTGSDSATAASFKLQSASPCIDAGTAYGNVTTDISGNQRALSVWTSYSTPPKSNFAEDLVINSYRNMAAQYQRPGSPAGYDMGAFEFPTVGGITAPINASNVDQVPFSLGAKGPTSIRLRTLPYKVEKD